MEIQYYNHQTQTGRLIWTIKDSFPTKLLAIDLGQDLKENINQILNKAIEYGEQKGKTWASHQLQEILKW